MATHDEIREYEAHYAAATAYEDTFPDHCRECWGTGTLWDEYDPSFGVGSLGSGTMVDAYPCHFCIDRSYNVSNADYSGRADRCPRCKGGIVTDPDHADDPITCDNCGFMDGVTAGHPGWPDEPYPTDPEPGDEKPPRYIESAGVWVNEIGEAL